MSQPEFSEEELRQLEAEMERITVDDVLIQTTVTLLNLAARKAGLGAPPGEAPPADWEQVRQAIEGARALLPLLESRHAEQLGPVRDTLSRLQMVYAQQAGGQPRRAAAAGRRSARGAREPEGAGPGAELRPPLDPGAVSAALRLERPINCATALAAARLRPPLSCLSERFLRGLPCPISCPTTGSSSR